MQPLSKHSMSAINGSGYQVAYSTAMAAIAGMTLPIARAVGRYGIRCVGIEPGLFDIPEVQDFEDTVNILSKMIPFPRRLGTPDEYAKLVNVCFLLLYHSRLLFGIQCSMAAIFSWMEESDHNLFVGLTNP